MKKSNKEEILLYLDTHYNDVKGELTYTKDYELLIAVVLSAQATDVAVNKVTSAFFSRINTFALLESQSVEDFALAFKSLGLYKNKAKYVHALVKILAEQYSGIVPNTKEELLKLPGVGVKTANEVLAELYNIPGIAVDTHVFRVAKRLGFAKQTDNVSQVEEKLKRKINKNRWIKTHHQFIHFGRYFCKAQNPKCFECELKHLCHEKNKNLR